MKALHKPVGCAEMSDIANIYPGVQTVSISETEIAHHNHKEPVLLATLIVNKSVAKVL